MGHVCTVVNDIELLYVVGCVNNVPFKSYKDYSFRDLKKGDVFRLKVGEQNELVRDFYGSETFTCASDAYYDELTGWKVELEE